MKINRFTRKVKLIEKEGGEHTKKKVEYAYDARAVATELLKNETQEVFIVIALDESSSIVGYREIARGTLNRADFEMIHIFQFLMLTNTKRFIVAHNHISDSCDPSEADDKATWAIRDASKIMEAKFLDHIIVSRNSSYSYEENGRLENDCFGFS